MKNNIILASGSPRRIEMMKQNGYEPIVIKPDVEENLPSGLGLHEAVMYLALKKAIFVEENWLSKLQNLNASSNTPPLILAADTVVYKGEIIGKPKDEADAHRIFELLRNSTHTVCTGVAAIIPGTTHRRIFYDETLVFFKDYSKKDVQAYLDSGEPWDKAGGYAIQGGWGKYVDHIEGDFDNVIGFPFSRIKEEAFPLLGMLR